MVSLAGVDGGHEVGRVPARGARMTELVEPAEAGCKQKGEGRDGRGHLGGVAGLSRIVYTLSTILVKWVSMAAMGLDWRGVRWGEG